VTRLGAYESRGVSAGNAATRLSDRDNANHSIFLRAFGISKLPWVVLAVVHPDFEIWRLSIVLLSFIDLLFLEPKIYYLFFLGLEM
jgi:hypothetical protein